jgi:hypothetical protein
MTQQGTAAFEARYLELLERLYAYTPIRLYAYTPIRLYAYTPMKRSASNVL